ncbi:winged helix-turn-helix transcriptional regulator [Nocardia pneumoniae]|uniref:winged helix-turn-helix transcriptional regulator n=1 Tax=Nocardia pneumoniae TaxID=228601 RepID=UPI000A3048A7|nr:helix-turn-helix domain-containing protein [Nocardia pneumoniae]
MRTYVESSGLPADVYSAKCPTRQVLDHIAGKWTVLIVDALAEGTMRYTDLHQRIEGISQKMLTQTLRRLETDGFVVRTVHPTVPPRVEYTLTDLGHSLRVPIAGLREWIETNINRIEAERRDSAVRNAEGAL